MRSAVYTVMDIRDLWDAVMPALRADTRLDQLTDAQCFDTWLAYFARQQFKVVDDEAQVEYLPGIPPDSWAMVMEVCESLWQRLAMDIPIACYSRDVVIKRIKNHVIWFFLDYYQNVNRDL